jgi:hypothetical protein
VHHQCFVLVLLRYNIVRASVWYCRDSVLLQTYILLPIIAIRQLEMQRFKEEQQVLLNKPPSAAAATMLLFIVFSQKREERARPLGADFVTQLGGYYPSSHPS